MAQISILEQWQLKMSLGESSAWAPSASRCAVAAFQAEASFDVAFCSLSSASVSVIACICILFFVGARIVNLDTFYQQVQGSPTCLPCYTSPVSRSKHLHCKIWNSCISDSYRVAVSVASLLWVMHNKLLFVAVPAFHLFSFLMPVRALLCFMSSCSCSCVTAFAV